MMMMMMMMMMLVVSQSCIFSYVGEMRPRGVAFSEGEPTME